MIVQIETSTGAFLHFRNGFSRPGASLSQSARAAGYAGRGYDGLEDVSELVVRIIPPSLEADEVLVAVENEDGLAGWREGDEWMVRQRKRRLADSEIAEDVSRRRTALIASVDDECARREAAGYSHSDGHVYQIDTLSQTRLLSAFTLLSQGVPAAHRGYWRDAGNVDRVMDDEAAKTFFAAALSYAAELVAAVHAHKGQLREIDTVIGLEAYSITENWP